MQYIIYKNISELPLGQVWRDLACMYAEEFERVSNFNKDDYIWKIGYDIYCILIKHTSSNLNHFIYGIDVKILDVGNCSNCVFLDTKTIDELNEKLCEKCCHWYGPGNHCDSAKRFCKNNDHFVPKKNLEDTKDNLCKASSTVYGNALKHMTDTLSKIKFSPQPKIENVIFNDPATIVFWQDGTKTVVKCHDSVFDPEKGLAMAISKKALGNKYDYYEEFEKWLPKEEKFDGVESTLRKLSDALSGINLSGCIPKRIFPLCDVTPNTEDIPSCTDCEYCSTEMYKQPCKDCLNDMTRPGFKKVTEEIEDRLCSKCVHKSLKYTEEPCTSCFHDYTRPNFKKAEDK